MGVSKTTTRFLVQNMEQRWVINPGGGGVEDNESHFGQADEQSFDASVTKRGPQGWYGSWPRLLAISMAAWPMGPPQPCSSATAEDCRIPGAPRALGGPKTAACPCCTRIPMDGHRSSPDTHAVVNLPYQFNSAVVPRYLVKPHSAYVCEDGSQGD